MKPARVCKNKRGSVDHATAEDDDESYAKSSITPGNSEAKNDTVAKVLGMNWDTVEDNFFFNFTDLCDYGMSPPATKRSVLKLSAMVFDPMGFRTLNIRTIIMIPCSANTCMTVRTIVISHHWIFCTIILNFRKMFR